MMYRKGQSQKWQYLDNFNMLKNFKLLKNVAIFKNSMSNCSFLEKNSELQKLLKTYERSTSRDPFLVGVPTQINMISEEFIAFLTSSACRIPRSPPKR